MRALKQPPHKDGFVCLGVVVAAHGICGEVKLKSFTVVPTDMNAYGPLVDFHGRSFVIEKLRGGAKDVLIGRIADLTTRNEAETLKGTCLYVPQAALPREGQGMLYVDLVGLPVWNPTGETMGTVQQVFYNGAHDVLEINRGNAGKLMLVPVADEYINQMDEKGVVLTDDALVFGEL